MEVSQPVEAFDASFDIVARQDAADAAIGVIRADVDEVKSRLDRVARAATRPALAGTVSASPELKGFVNLYLRQGRETELKSLSGVVLADGGYAVPREIDAMIAARLKDGRRDQRAAIGQLRPVRAAVSYNSSLTSLATMDHRP